MVELVRQVGAVGRDTRELQETVRWVGGWVRTLKLAAANVEQFCQEYFSSQDGGGRGARIKSPTFSERSEGATS